MPPNGQLACLLVTLGTLDLRCPEGRAPSFSLSQSKLMGLLVFLAVARPRGMHRRDSLLAMFWPELDQPSARAALRQALYSLRRRLPGGFITRRGKEEVGTDPAWLGSDVEAFEAALGVGDHDEALRIYGGDFLEGFFLSACPLFEQWLDTERFRLREMATDAAWSAADRYLRNGRLTEAERIAQRAVDLDPTAEKEVRAFVDAMEAAGHPAAALRFCERFGTILREELGIRPSGATRAVEDRIRTTAVGREDVAGSTSFGREVDTRPSIAVLPFTSFGDEPEAAVFGMGLVDDLLNRLSAVKEIRVVSRVAPVSLLEDARGAAKVAAELGVRTVLDGSVRQVGDRMRIVVRLMDGVTEEHLWSESYDREAGDTLRIQAEVAERMATALGTELSEDEPSCPRPIPTGSLPAWHAYNAGVAALRSMSSGDVEEAVRQLTRAVGEDPGFAGAWGRLAQVTCMAGMCAREEPTRCFGKATKVAGHALELDPACGNAHAALGLVHLLWGQDVDGADEEFSIALSLDSHDPLAMGWRSLGFALSGRAPQAVDLARQTVAAAPLAVASHAILGQVLLLGDRPDEAVGVLEAALRLWPRALRLHAWIGVAHLLRVDPEPALRHIDAAIRASGQLPHLEALRATALADLGLRGEARRILRTLEVRSRREYVDPFGLFAASLAGEGAEAALPHLEAMRGLRSVFLPYLGALPRLERYLGDGALRDILKCAWPLGGTSRGQRSAAGGGADRQGRSPSPPLPGSATRRQRRMAPDRYA